MTIAAKANSIPKVIETVAKPEAKQAASQPVEDNLKNPAQVMWENGGDSIIVYFSRALFELCGLKPVTVMRLAHREVFKSAPLRMDTLSVDLCRAPSDEEYPPLIAELSRSERVAIIHSYIAAVFEIANVALQRKNIPSLQPDIIQMERSASGVLQPVQPKQPKGVLRILSGWLGLARN